MPKFLVWVMLCLLLLGCGRKEMPQLENTEQRPPIISQLSHTVTGQVVQFNLKLEGGKQGIGYQVDRTSIDPYCKCAGSWQRYSEMAPQLRHQGQVIRRIFTLPLEDTVYLFRIRAVDAQGHLGSWSKTMQAHSDKNRLK